jgi:diguanylate cyclase (GGDEF)-like protein/PAS domain S-box-containing protein
LIAEMIAAGAENKHLRFLLIEDNPTDVELLEYELRHAGFEFSLAVVQTSEEFTRELRATAPHLVMADYNLPGWRGIEALEIVEREGQDVPLILVTGALADTTAVDCIKQGATDYVLKGSLARLPVAIRRALQEKNVREQRKRTEQELQLTQFSVEHASDAVFWVDPCGRFVYANQAGCHSLEYSREELLSLSVSDVDPLVAQQGWGLFWEEIKTRRSITFEAQHRTKEGRSFPVEITANYLEFDGREYSFSFVRDITERKAAEARIKFLAYSDALTGLPNRRLLQDRLTMALASARRRGHKVALLFLDLDRFKSINDSLGHSAADLLLQEVAQRLAACGREQDTIARIGGDEFLIVLTGLKDATDAAVAAERLMDAIVGEYSIQGQALHLTCSLGISIFPEQGTDTETLIKNADTAMFNAKESGRNGFRFFTQDIDNQALERLTLENSLRLAMDKEELFLVYQPQMDLATGRIIGLEVLLRWRHPKFGLVPPDKFIPIAENCGVIVPIGEWVMRTACSQARKWQESGLPAVRLAVNVSAVQFRRQGFSECVRRVLRETDLAPQYLELELTESLLLANAEVNLSVIKELNAIGLALAIDDFGTGYSNFGYLKQFRVSKLKIDGSFIRDLAVNPDDAAITAAIISMAKSLRLKVIAECVEDEAQMSFLRAHHCDEVQGYYFSKPLAVDEVANKLRGEDSTAHAVFSQANGKAL